MFVLKYTHPEFHTGTRQGRFPDRKRRYTNEGYLMRAENIVYFTDDEEECANLLIAIGLKRYVAKTLVFLSGNPSATSRAIERGTDLRQPEVSIAVGEMTKLGWIRNHECEVKGQGRPIKVYKLIKTLPEILESIEKKKQKEAEQERQIMEKLRVLAG